MEKTKEQKQASRQRFFAQRDKAITMLKADNLYDFIEGLKYAYSLSMRYRSVNLKDLLTDNCHIDLFNKNSTKSPFDKCLKCGILKPWNDTYRFDKEKAESLQQYILEHSN